MAAVDAILRVEDLRISFYTPSGKVEAVRGASFDLVRGETLAVVGESGSGKTVAAKGLMGLLPGPGGVVEGGRAIFEGRDLLELSEKEMRRVRGDKISMVFQDPTTSLDPTMRIGRQITEPLGLGRRRATTRAVELLRTVGIPDPEERVGQYPHQLSGGMRQRIVIAMALARDPEVILADEPTTALDVTIQAQILELLKGLQARKGTSIVLITHDLGVVAGTAHRVAVMYSGKVVETGTVREVFYAPKHPYTWGLLRSVPRLSAGRGEELVPIPGSPPDPLDPPQGCPFSRRCPHAMKICVSEMPPHFEFSPGHRAACWLYHELAPGVRPPRRPPAGGGG